MALMDTWSHSADDKLRSRPELDIVIIEGKRALTGVTAAAAAEAQQTPQGTELSLLPVNP